jgi:hypothetical protein
MNDWLSLNSTRELLGVDPAVPAGFAACNDTVGNAFAATLDEYHETYTQVSQLLERGVRVLVYAGTYDWICNWISNEVWTLKMPWSGQDAFVKQPLTDWLIDGHVVGKTRSANGLTFATVNEAGHMVGPSSRVGTPCSQEVRFRLISPRTRWCLFRSGWKIHHSETHTIPVLTSRNIEMKLCGIFWNGSVVISSYPRADM